MITKTLGTSGADFSSINAWVSWVQANAVTAGVLTDSVTLDVLNVGVTPSGPDTISGWTSAGGTFTTTLTALGSHSFAGNASASSNALIYNTANGAFIDYSSSSSDFLTATVDYFTLSRLQMKFAEGHYQTGISLAATTTYTLSGNIFSQVGGGGTNQHLLDGGTVTSNINNNLFQTQGSFENVLNVGTGGANNTNIYFNTFYNDSGFNARAIIINRYDFATSKNNAFWGFSDELIQGGINFNNSSTNDATTNAAFNTFHTITSPQYSIVAATELVGGGSYNDFRLASGSVKCKNNGVTGTGITTDIIGTTRSGSTPCIGCWEIASGGGSVGSIAIDIAVAGTGAAKFAAAGTVALDIAVAGHTAETVAAAGAIALNIAVAGATGETIAAVGAIGLNIDVAGSTAEKIAAAGAISLNIDVAGVSPSIIAATGTIGLNIDVNGVWNPPVTIIDQGDPGLRKKKHKRFEDEAERRRRHRAEIVAAYEWAVEGKPQLAAEVAQDFTVMAQERRPGKPTISRPAIDFTRLLEDVERTEQLLAAYQAMLEQDDEDVLVLI